MADNVTTQSATLATIPSGTEIATDDAGAGGHVQFVKLANPADGSATAWGDSSDGLPVELTNADAIAIAGVDQHIATIVTTGLETAGTPYVAGDMLDVQFELTNMAAFSAGGGVITTVTLRCDVPAILSGIRLWLFSASVTPAADASPMSFSDADIDKCVGTITLGIPASNALNSIATSVNINLDYSCADTSLFVCMETLNNISSNFAAADDIHLSVVTYRLAS